MTTTSPIAPDAPREDDWIDDRELARRTPIARATYQAWRARGGGPPYSRVGRRCLYSWARVRAWLAAHEVAQ